MPARTQQEQGHPGDVTARGAFDFELRQAPAFELGYRFVRSPFGNHD
jgi:hypothetical protein